MKTKSVFTFFIFLPVIIFAQNEHQNNSSNNTINELKYHKHYLASDALKGRFPGEIGCQKAVEYAVSQFNPLKLKPLFIDENSESTCLQKISFEKYIWNAENRMIQKKKTEKQELKQSMYYVLFSGKPFDATKMNGDAVFVSAGIKIILNIKLFLQFSEITN